MAQFRGTVVGNRSTASRLGTRNSGLHGTIHGWHIGLSLHASYDPDEDRDMVSASLTSGSGGHNDKLPDLFIEADNKGSYRIRLNGRMLVEHKAEFQKGQG